MIRLQIIILVKKKQLKNCLNLDIKAIIKLYLIKSSVKLN